MILLLVTNPLIQVVEGLPIQPPQHVRYDLASIKELPSWRSLIIEWVLGNVVENWGYLKLSGLIGVEENVPIIYISGSDLPILWRLESFDYFDGYGWTQLHHPKYYRISEFHFKNAEADYVFNIIIPNVSGSYGGLLPIPTIDENLVGFNTTIEDATIYYSDTGALFAFADILEENFNFSVSYSKTTFNLTEVALSSLDDIPPSVKGVYTSLPPNIPRDIYDIADMIANENTIFADEVCALIDYLAANYTYNENVEIGEDEDPVVTFFEKREGNSAQLSTAMVLILRRLGIPSRIVIGFKPSNRKAEGYWIYSGDIRMWVEVYFPNVGWTPIDPTPEEHTSDVLPITALSRELSRIKIPQAEQNQAYKSGNKSKGNISVGEGNISSGGNVSSAGNVSSSGNVSLGAGNTSLIGAGSNTSQPGYMEVFRNRLVGLLVLVLSLLALSIILLMSSRGEPAMEPPKGIEESLVPEYLKALTDRVISFYDSGMYRDGMIYLGGVFQKIMGDIFSMGREEWETFREYIRRIIDLLDAGKEKEEILNALLSFTVLYEKSLYAPDPVDRNDFLRMIQCFSSIIDYFSGKIGGEVSAAE